MIPIEPDDQTGSWNGSNRHYFLTDGSQFEKALKLRNKLRNLHDTVLFVTRSKLGVEPHPHTLWLMDSWKVPEYMTTGATATFVNPNNPDKWKYSPAFTRCKCGAVMKLSEQEQAASSEHSNDCHMFYRKEARADICRRRTAIMRTLGRLNKGVYTRPQFFGYNSKLHGGFADQLGVDPGQERESGAQLIAKTSKILLTDWTPKQVAGVYDCHPETIRRFVKRHTNTTAGELQSERQSCS